LRAQQVDINSRRVAMCLDSLLFLAFAAETARRAKVAASTDPNAFMSQTSAWNRKFPIHSARKIAWR